MNDVLFIILLIASDYCLSMSKNDRNREKLRVAYLFFLKAWTLLTNVTTHQFYQLGSVLYSQRSAVNTWSWYTQNLKWDIKCPISIFYPYMPLK